MATRIIKFAFVLSLVAFLAACTSKGGSCSLTPTAPSCGGNGGGDPDQTGLDPLGTLYRLKAANGSDTSMWVKLLSVTPQRRATLVGDSVCGGVCYTFEFSAEIGKDAEPARRSFFTFSLSQDCTTPIEGSATSDTVEAGASKVFSSGRTFHRFDTTPTPKCLLVKGEHFLNGGGVVGTYPIVLDYKR